MSDAIKDVRLSFCCKENWNAFATVDERKRFCASCKHNVVDFTNANKEDLNQARQSGQRVCGHFKLSQMNKAFARTVIASLALGTAAVSCTEPSEVNPELPVLEVAPTDVPPEISFYDLELTGIIVFDSLDVEWEPPTQEGLESDTVEESERN